MSRSKLILGTAQFGLAYGISNSKGKPTEETIGKVLDTAHKNGVRILDTAEAYGDAQQRIGKYHASSPFQFEIITKFSASVSHLPNSIIERVEKNLQLLNVSSLYCYMFHSYSDFERYYNVFEKSLKELKEQGKIQKIGVSVYTNEEFEKVLDVGGISVIQLPFNILDNISKRGELIALAQKRGVEVHTRSVFLQGLFFLNPAEFTGNISELFPYVKKLQDLCNGELAMNELALNYVIKQDDIDYVLLGVDSVEHLEQNLRALELKIPGDVYEFVDNINVKDDRMLNPSNWRK